MSDHAGVRRAVRADAPLSDDRKIFLLAAAARDAAHSNVAEAVTWARCVRDRIYPRTAAPTVRDRWQTMKVALNHPKPGSMGTRGPDLERVLAAWERQGIGTAAPPEGTDDPRRAFTERLVILRLEEVLQGLRGPMPSIGVRAAQELRDALPPPPPGLDPAVAIARDELVDALEPVDNFSDPREVTRELADALGRLRAAYYGELVYDEAPEPVRAVLFPRGRPSRAQLVPALPREAGRARDLPETALLPGDPRVSDHVVAALRHADAGAWDGAAGQARRLAVHMVTDADVVPDGPVRAAWTDLADAAADLARAPREAATHFRQAAHAYEEAVDRETGTPAQRLARLDPDVLGGLWASFFALRQAVGEPPPARAALVAGAVRLSRAQMQGIDTITRLELDERLERVESELGGGDAAAAARVADVAVFQCERAADRRWGHAHPADR